MSCELCYWHHFTDEKHELNNLPKVTKLVHAEQDVKPSDLTPDPALLTIVLAHLTVSECMWASVASPDTHIPQP